MNKPKFDPGKSFETVSEKPAFDPSKPFDTADESSEEPIEGPTYTTKSGEKIPIMTGAPVAAMIPQAAEGLIGLLPQAASDVGTTGGLLARATPEAPSLGSRVLGLAKSVATSRPAKYAAGSALGAMGLNKLRGLLR